MDQKKLIDLYDFELYNDNDLFFYTALQVYLQWHKIEKYIPKFTIYCKLILSTDLFPSTNRSRLSTPTTHISYRKPCSPNLPRRRTTPDAAWTPDGRSPNLTRSPLIPVTSSSYTKLKVKNWENNVENYEILPQLQRKWRNIQ